MNPGIETLGQLFRKVYTDVDNLEDAAGSVVLTSTSNAKQDCVILCSKTEKCGGTYYNSASGKIDMLKFFQIIKIL